MQPLKPRSYLPALAALAVLAFGGCGKHETSHPEKELPEAEVRVRKIEVTESMSAADIMGSVQAAQTANISAKVSGAITEVKVTPGERVKAEDLLVSIDAREIKARRDEAQAVCDQAKADFKRYETLLKEKAVTHQEFDQVNSRLKSAEARLLEADTMLEYTLIKAPFDGVITRKNAEVGDLATPGKPLLSMENDSTLQFAAQVDETLVNSIKTDDELKVEIDTANAILNGKVSEIAPSANPASRTFLVKLELPSAEKIRPGQFGRMAIPFAKKDAIQAPVDAVVRRGQLEMVFVVHEKHAVMRLVKTGRRRGDSVEIISGLEAGETIVVEGAAHLQDGQPLLISE